jgi:Double zinc ribbon
MPFALFGIDNDALNLTVNLLILFLVVVYLALIAWTFFDARRRMKDPVLIACSVGASLFPFIGTVIYSILRPPEYLEDRRERELEIRAAELRVRQLAERSCPKCEYPLEKGFLRCPNCQARVKDPCPSCGEPIDPRWSMCPYCETPLRREPPKRRPAEPERRPTREPERRPARQPERAPARAARASASQKRAPQKRAAKRPAGQTQRRKAAAEAARRTTGQRGSKPSRDERTAERRATGDGGEPSRPATAS